MEPVSRGPRVVILGKQGAGKGTQSRRVAEHYGVEHLATGDLFRAAVRSGSELGTTAKRYMDAGDLVPDDITVGVVEERFREHRLPDLGFVLDGFPRTRKQAEALERVLEQHPLDIVIDLEVPTDVVLARIAHRKATEGRDDDTDAAVKHRLDLYERETAPLIGFYRDLGRLTEVDGVGEPDDVFKRLVNAIDERLP